MDPHRAARERAASLPLDALSTRLAGDVVAPTDDGYDEARRVWNGMVNAYPTAIAYCQSTDDVVDCVAFARDHDRSVSVRSGGHSVSGASVAGDLVVDCSRMEWVRVDPDARTARVGPGATWGTVDRATQSVGLATPGGVYSETGVAGLTLGGGTGYLSPKHGFTADNLRAVDVVTGTGERITADAERNADLLWAARGGGTVGVVTAFEFELHPLDHDVAYAESWLPLDEAGAALAAYRSYQRTAPAESCVFPYFDTVPSTAAFPSERRGDPALVLAGVYAGAPEHAREGLGPVVDHDAAFASSFETMSYLELQTMMDDDFPAGRRYYWKSVPLATLEDGAIETLRDAAERAPSSLSTIVLWPMHGAVSEAEADTSPVVGRDAAVVANVEAAWDDPLATERTVEWVRETCRELRADASLAGTLPNFAGGSDPDADDVYAGNAARLREVRERYDPDGIFTHERE
ncbi:FAD-binding oxidoreductase [Halobellus sp. EA9]|uniref:FAD-binding oxidoreductase n=1 Tax=Halobellus sp. EA9 TaxID=3421647 RepID=UPI003EB9532D